MAMITTTTKISTSVKPLLRMLRQRPAVRLFLESRGTDVRVVAFAAGLAVAAVAGDFVITAIGPRTHVLIRVVPRVLRQRSQVAARAVVRDRRIDGLLDQGLQSLFGGGVLEVVQPVQVQ